MGGVFSAGAFVLSARLLPLEALAASANAPANAAPTQPGIQASISGIETDGTVIVVAHRSEMGTGIRTALPMIVADELDADWARIKVEQALGDAKYGSQNTDGSCSIRDFADAMRDAGATARLMLELRGGNQMGRPCRRVQGSEPSGCSCAQQTQARLRRAGFDCGKAVGPKERGTQIQACFGVSLHRQGHADG